MTTVYICSIKQNKTMRTAKSEAKKLAHKLTKLGKTNAEILAALSIHFPTALTQEQREQIASGAENNQI